MWLICVLLPSESVLVVVTDIQASLDVLVWLYCGGVEKSWSVIFDILGKFLVHRLGTEGRSHNFALVGDRFSSEATTKGGGKVWI